jgi:4'-phosphopantetheinyl transferase
VAVTSIDGIEAPELAALTGRLRDADAVRARTLGVEAARARFAVGRLLLQASVARATGCPPSVWRVDVEPSGRPIVLGTPRPIFVSLAHSGRYVVTAVADRPVGVDVEELRRVRPGLAARVCSADELRSLAAMSGAERDRAFMAVWTRKEAYGKASGAGLGFALRAVTAGPAGSRVTGGTGRWRVVDLEIDPAYAAAVVGAGRRWRVDVERIDRTAL